MRTFSRVTYFAVLGDRIKDKNDSQGGKLWSIKFQMQSLLPHSVHDFTPVLVINSMHVVWKEEMNE